MKMAERRLIRAPALLSVLILLHFHGTDGKAGTRMRKT